MPATNRSSAVLAVLWSLCGLSGAFADDDALDPLRQWPQWRGPLGTGAAPFADPPIRWAEDENVRWKLPVPGRGLSTPIVWGDRLVLTTAVPFGEATAPTIGHDPGAHDNIAATRRHEFVVLAVDRRRGELLWQRTVRRERPHEATHVTGSWASSSAVTDGEHVWAFFGSRGLHALDLDDGELLWQKDFGDMQTRHEHGEGASPALWGDTLVVNWDHQGESFVVALDKGSGDERWRAVRDEITSWSTPLVVEHAGAPQVVIAATGRVRAYDLATGRVLWETAGLSRNVVASPVAADGLVVVAGSYDWQAMLAIRLEHARGDLSERPGAIAWSRSRDTPYVPSPVLDGGRLCFLKHLHGVLTCVELATGATLFGPARLPGAGSIFASPVAAAGRIYIVSREGRGFVVRGEAPFEVLAHNRLDDAFSASPAVVGDTLYLRGSRSLYALDPAPTAPAPIREPVQDVE